MKLKLTQTIDIITPVYTSSGRYESCGISLEGEVVYKDGYGCWSKAPAVYNSKGSYVTINGCICLYIDECIVHTLKKGFYQATLMINALRKRQTSTTYVESKPNRALKH